jgi:hypothetical protein
MALSLEDALRCYKERSKAMKCLKLTGLCLVVVLVLGAASAASASAASGPVFSKVIVEPLKEGEKVPFTSTTGKTTLETVGKEKIVCLSSIDKGELTGPTSLVLAVAFKGCEHSATKCTSAGAAEGEIVTNAFEGKLGNLKSESTPGVALFQEKTKPADAEFTCGTTKIKLFGGVVGPITPAGTAVTKLKLSYKETAGIQLFENIFGGPLDNLSASFGEGKAERMGLTGTDTLTLSKPIQVG